MTDKPGCPQGRHSGVTVIIRKKITQITPGVNITTVKLEID